ncbi:MAG: FkbM family methyltransferase [Planctomycetia bacterium]|nr:FkbM family methyltransferase [Planctomycetia bacterium]
MSAFPAFLPWRELMPPVVEKLLQRIPFGGHRRHPFTAFPASLDARVILDVGANIGRVAEAGLRTYARSEVHCFEPVSATFETLSRRLARFGDRVHLHNFALSDQNGEAVINLTSFHGANSLHPQADLHKRLNPHVRELGTERIRLQRLDDLAGSLPPFCDIMKIDVEGHELQVLEGGEAFIRERVDTVLIEISLMRDQSWEHQCVFDIFAMMKKLGFGLINVIDLHRAPQPDMMLVQMDCLFRNHRRLTTPTVRNGSPK